MYIFAWTFVVVTVRSRLKKKIKMSKKLGVVSTFGLQEMNNRRPKMLMSSPRLLIYLFVQNYNSICLCVCCKENLDVKKKKSVDTWNILCVSTIHVIQEFITMRPFNYGIIQVYTKVKFMIWDQKPLFDLE